MIAIQDGHIPRKAELSSEPEPQIDDSVLSISPEIVETLGVQRVDRLEALELQLGWIEAVLVAENPFCTNGPSEVDLSFLGRNGAYKLETYNPALHKIHPQLAYRVDEISLLASQTANSCIEGMRQVQIGIKKLEAREDLDVAEAISGLTKMAELLPQPATLKTMRNMFRFTADHATTIDLLADVEAPTASTCEPSSADVMLSWSDSVVRGVETVRDNAKENYDRQLTLLAKGEAGIAVELLQALEEAGQHISGQIIQVPKEGREEFVVRDLYSLKDYLLAKAALAKQCLEAREPALLEEEEIAESLRRFSPDSDEIAEETSHQKSERRRGITRHRTNTLNARDILKGGQRLLTKKDKGSAVEQMAKGLHDTRKQHELTYAEIGLLVAAVKGKKIAEEFLRTCKLAVDIQTSQIRSRALHEVYAAHPMVYLELSQLDPRQMVRNIATVLRNANDELGTLFAPHHEDLEELFVEQQLLPREMRDKQ